MPIYLQSVTPIFDHRFIIFVGTIVWGIGYSTMQYYAHVWRYKYKEKEREVEINHYLKAVITQ